MKKRFPFRILVLTVIASIPAISQQTAQHQPTSAELSRDETPGKAILRTFEFQEYLQAFAARAANNSSSGFCARPTASKPFRQSRYREMSAET